MIRPAIDGMIRVTKSTVKVFHAPFSQITSINKTINDYIKSIENSGKQVDIAEKETLFQNGIVIISMIVNIYWFEKEETKGRKNDVVSPVNIYWLEKEGIKGRKNDAVSPVGVDKKKKKG